MVYLLPKKDMMANIYILLYKINPLWISGFFHGWSLPEKPPYLDTFHTVSVGSIPVTRDDTVTQNNRENFH